MARIHQSMLGRLPKRDGPELPNESLGDPHRGRFRPHFRRELAEDRLKTSENVVLTGQKQRGSLRWIENGPSIVVEDVARRSREQPHRNIIA